MRIALSLAAGIVLGALAVGADAEACGGCFVPPSAADALVTGHRMAFAVSEGRTVLWDQIQYSGEPSDFSWVLPIAPGAIIEESTAAWFEALDAVTKTTVLAPQLLCATSIGSSGCGFSSSNAVAESARGNVLGDGVAVLHQGTVGPYDTVTLRSTDGGSLRDWLGSHGYAIQPDVEPVIDAYVSEGADFIALRLQATKGVDQMTPVRVVTQSGRPILPLRMVAAGTGSSVDIVLFVIGEKRLGLADLTEVHLDPSRLTFDFAKTDSNYLQLRASGAT